MNTVPCPSPLTLIGFSE